MENENIIIKIREISCKTSINQHEQISLFTWMRKLLENNELRIEYPVLYFYCNWVLHIEIDRDKICAEAILRCCNSVRNADKIFQNTILLEIWLQKSLLFRQLIVDIIKLFENFSIKPTFFNDSGKYDFLTQLIKQILLDNKVFIVEKNKKHIVFFKKITEDFDNKDEVYAINSINFKFIKDYWSKGDETYVIQLTNRKDITISIPLSFTVWSIVLDKETSIDEKLDI